MNLIASEHTYFRRAQFLLSVPEFDLLPADHGVEVAVVGRSNVGKSSVLNALCDQRGLARTSRTPGRTQHIVVFDLAQRRRLLDLPGFGYAAVGREMRAHWAEVVPRVLHERKALVGLLLLADARLPLKPEERELLTWCMEAAVPVQLALNKADKLTRQAQATAVRLAQQVLTASGITSAPILASATTRVGIDLLRHVLHGWFERGLEGLKEGPGTHT